MRKAAPEAERLERALPSEWPSGGVPDVAFSGSSAGGARNRPSASLSFFQRGLPGDIMTILSSFAFHRWVPALALPLVAACATTPLTAPVSAPSFAIGDRWQYRVIDGFRHEQVATVDSEVVAVNGGEATLRVFYTDDRGRTERTERLSADGGIRVGPAWRQETREFAPPLRELDFPLTQGRSWNQTVSNVHLDTREPEKGVINNYGRVIGHAPVTVPAGTFDAVHVYRILQLDDEEFWRTRTTLRNQVWYAPQVKAIVREIRDGEYREKGDAMDSATVRNEYSIYELTSFAPGLR